ncbi:hypothetical protein [Sinosporangium siamense]|uniref:hypothetical protein n=1 Tax=Sinosporangium siamense TaxID=1367973 RepID=UPI00194FB352|nr:hypothetical protein [Sinosporangium siamense]
MNDLPADAVTTNPMPAEDTVPTEDQVPAAEPFDDFYAPAVSLNRLRARVGVPAAAPPDLLLRALEPPEVKVRHIPLLDILRSAYRGLESEER